MVAQTVQLQESYLTTSLLFQFCDLLTVTSDEDKGVLPYIKTILVFQQRGGLQMRKFEHINMLCDLNNAKICFSK